MGSFFRKALVWLIDWLAGAGTAFLIAWASGFLR